MKKIILSLLIVMSSSTTFAQIHTGELAQQRNTSVTLGGELGFFNRDGAPNRGFAIIAPNFFGRIRVMGTATPADGIVDLVFAWRWAGLAGTDSMFRAGNPFVGARFGWDWDNAAFHFGGGFTLPIMNIIHGEVGGGAALEAGLLGHNMAMYGNWDGWLIDQDSMALVLRSDGEVQDEHFFAGIQADVGFVFDVARKNRIDSLVNTRLQGAIYGGYRFTPTFRVGVRLQEVWDFQSGADSGALISFARYEAGSAWVEPRVLVQLDETVGAYKVWSVAVNLGTRF